MSTLTSAGDTRNERQAVLGTLIAGTMQAVFALAILFLPIMPAGCNVTSGGAVCVRLPYIEMQGSAAGYGYLALMFGIGIGAALFGPGRLSAYACAFRWLAALASISFVVVGAWSIGFLFLPGGVLMILAALSCVGKPRQPLLGDH